eukprot:CCRYP_015321-RA/>CCRYP_015321-RA protein AED:0.39 eAED:0.39 QI:276/1/1/1/0/0/2/487/250
MTCRAPNEYICQYSHVQIIDCHILILCFQFTIFHQTFYLYAICICIVAQAIPLQKYRMRHHLKWTQNGFHIFRFHLERLVVVSAGNLVEPLVPIVGNGDINNRVLGPRFIKSQGDNGGTHVTVSLRPRMPKQITEYGIPSIPHSGSIQRFRSSIKSGLSSDFVYLFLPRRLDFRDGVDEFDIPHVFHIFPECIVGDVSFSVEPSAHHIPEVSRVLGDVDGTLLIVGEINGVKEWQQESLSERAIPDDEHG